MLVFFSIAFLVLCFTISDLLVDCVCECVCVCVCVCVIEHQSLYDE